MSPTDAPRTSVKRLVRPAFWVTAVAALACGAVWSVAETAAQAKQVKRVFHFNASANAIGGTISRVGQTTAPHVPLFTQASSSLASVGGISVADQGKYRYWGFSSDALKEPNLPEKLNRRPIISFEDAHTSTVGEELSDGCHQTTVTSIVNGFNAEDRLTADTLAVSLTMKRCPDDDRDAVVKVETCEIDNLRIDGVQIQTPCDDALVKGHKLRAFLDEQSAKTGQKLASEHSMLQLSLLRKVGEKELAQLERQNKYADRGLHYRLLDDNGIYVPDFGKVYLGTFFIGPNKREVAMLHLELGSPVMGTLDAGDVGANGCYFP